MTDHVRHRRFRRIPVDRGALRPRAEPRARAPHVRRHPPSRARRRGPLGGRRRGARHAPAEHHRSLDRPSADSQRGPLGLGRVQRRDLQLPRAAPAHARGGGPSCSTRRPTPKSSSTPTSSGARTPLLGCAACSAWRSGTRDRGRCSSRATASASSRCTTRPSTGGCISDPRSSRCSRRPDCPRDLDLDALDHYLSFLYTPRDGSIFEQRPQAPAGSLPGLEERRGSRSSGTGSCRPTRPSRIRSRRGRAAAGCADRRRPLAPRQRRAARRVSVRRRRLEPRRRPDEPRRLRRAREDVLDRLRRTGVRRARARAARRAALRHRSSRVRRQAGRRRHPRPADLALRRAVRRFVGDPDVVRVGDGPAARHRRAVRRRRRRALRRLRAVPPAPARRRVRSLQPAGRSARRGAGRGHAAARRSRQELPAPCRARRSRPLPRRDPLLRHRREAGAAHDWTRAGACAAWTPNGSWPVTSSATRSCRGRAR